MASLARLSLLKSDALLNESASTYDDAMKYLLEQASEWVQSKCNRQLMSATVADEYYSGANQNELLLNEWPVSSLTSVSIWDTTTETYVSESTTYFQIIADNRRVNVGLYYPKLGQEDNTEYSNWPKLTAGNNIKLTYVAGYATTNWDTLAITATFAVPKDLEYAVAKLAALAWLEGRESEGRLGRTGISVGDQSFVIEQFEKGVPKLVQSTIAQYKRPSY